MASSASSVDIHNRRELMAHCHGASKGDSACLLECMCAYSPPAQRLIIISLEDFRTLGVTTDEVHGAGDETFWAYGDFPSVVASFSRAADDDERRVVGIEGIASAAQLKEAIASGKRTLKLGHLSLKMMRGKVANGEWRWIDEAACVMHTATAKPAFLRDKFKNKFGTNLRILRHEQFVEGVQESEGDLIIFDIDKANVLRRTGNTKVFCQNAANYTISSYDSLANDIRTAVAEMLALEAKPTVHKMVHNRRELMAHCYTAAGGNSLAVLDCMCAYSPPAQRLIIRSETDLVTLGVTSDEVHGAGDQSFWAYGDFANVVASFSRDPDDPERRVLGIEGIGSAAQLKEAIDSGKRTLKLGHLSLKMMKGKVANGEWRWIDEAGCIMHTATAKPAFLRSKLLKELQLSVKVLRHEKFIEGMQESCGDLIIFDMDKSDVRRVVGNNNVFCQDAANYNISSYTTLAEDIRSAVTDTLAFEMNPSVHGSLLGGSDEYYLAKISPAGVAMYQLPAQVAGSTEALFKGTVSEFSAEHGDEVAKQLRNASLTCKSCGKSNAVTLAACNGCDSSLAGAPTTATENVIMGFVYGIRRGAKIPLTLSLRGEDSSTLVYDDLLARSPCHLNAVPTDVHISDWRDLLPRPEESCTLLARLEEACRQAVETHFWNNDSWRSNVLRPGAVTSASEFLTHAILALNAVPSQYQLHLHCIMPPLLPETYHLTLRGGRWTKFRWLPLEYVKAALATLKTSGGLPNAQAMEHEEIFKVIADRGGPNYEDFLAAALRRYVESHELLANWRTECFEVAAIVTPRADESYKFGTLEQRPSPEGDGSDAQISCAGAATQVDAKATATSDKQLLQSYGRPYDSKGSPAPSSYYSFAKQPGDVSTWSSSKATTAS